MVRMNSKKIKSQINQAAANLAFTLQNKGLKNVVITSSNTGEGKTTVAIQLAKSLAQTGESVLLIDADFKNQGLTRDLNLMSRRGFSEVLSDYLQSKVVRKGFVVRSQANGVDILPVGKSEDVLKLGLTSQLMKEVLLQLGESHDIVIVDGTMVHSLETTMLASGDSGVLMVMRKNWTLKESVVQGLRQLERVNAQLLGFVLNDF